MRRSGNPRINRADQFPEALSVQLCQRTRAFSERLRPFSETSTVLRNAILLMGLFGQNQIVEQRRAMHDLREILSVIENFAQFRRQFGAMWVLPSERHV